MKNLEKIADWCLKIDNIEKKMKFPRARTED